MHHGGDSHTVAGTLLHALIHQPTPAAAPSMEYPTVYRANYRPSTAPPAAGFLAHTSQPASSQSSTDAPALCSLWLTPNSLMSSTITPSSTGASLLTTPPPTSSEKRAQSPGGAEGFSPPPPLPASGQNCLRKQTNA
ncbi:unnamed protein product [Arctogadus glacialis]